MGPLFGGSEGRSTFHACAAFTDSCLCGLTVSRFICGCNSGLMTIELTLNSRCELLDNLLCWFHVPSR